MRFCNLTPHTIRLFAPTVDRLFEPDPRGPARVATLPGTPVNISGVPVAPPSRLGEVTGLPEPEQGVLYIVSAVVGSALRDHRGDLVVPATAPEDRPIRDGVGRIFAVRYLKRP